MASPSTAMAEAGLRSERRQATSPLEDITNETTRHRHAPSKTLRRTRSFEALYRKLDSSESVPSIRESIWDASDVRSDECHGENGTKSPAPTLTNAAAPNGGETPSHGDLEEIDEFLDLATDPRLEIQLPTWSAAANVFHPHRLEPIAEHRSHASLHLSLARARLAQSHERSVTVVHPQQSHHSLQPSKHREWREETKDLANKRPRPKNCSQPLTHRRAFSLDDLDCLKLSSRGCREKLSRSSSSDAYGAARYRDANEDKICWPAEPRRPTNPPPARAPTPQGVPTFGTKEAINYFNRPRARSSWWCRGRNARPDASTADASAAAAAARALAANPNPPPTIPKRHNAFRRISSLFACPTARNFSSGPRRSSLPPGVLLADDGTFVRGRFGGRVSGHGIGMHGLDGHPIQRMAARPAQGKDRNSDSRVAAPTGQVGNAQSHDQPLVMSGAAGARNPVHRASSLFSTCCAWDTWRSCRRRQQQQQQQQGNVAGEQQQQREDHPIATAAGVNGFSVQNSSTLHLPRARVDNDRPRGVDNEHPALATSLPSRSEPAQPSTSWPRWRWFGVCCCCCCEMMHQDQDQDQDQEPHGPEHRRLGGRPSRGRV